MNEPARFDFRDFQRWRRPIEVGFWVTLTVLNTVFNALVSRIDHARTAPWEPWVWECTSSLLILALIPVVVALERRWPVNIDSWRRSLPLHLLATIPFSVVHVAGMVALRKLAYALADAQYRFGAQWGYEYLKDIRTYFLIIALICLSRLWLMRWQGEARLLAEPDEGQAAEPVDRPDRFLVRKLGREFLLNASEVEWLQASGNYVNLHVRGRDYPLRSTMAAISERLHPERFVRVHRSYFVNLDYLVQIELLDTGDARLTLRDGATIPCSRRYRAALREHFGS
ncbi:LytTR family DNA-binding domain-containing protein [Rhodanobacter caeni]|uniref:LytTR family DNA-binding domain-containing protein n=1 Tax=Rhodanobacter caeni TaxID=657654 RepID=A0ABN0US93_9GAMM